MPAHILVVSVPCWEKNASGPNHVFSTGCAFPVSVRSESAVGESGADDGVVFPPLSCPDERRQVPSFC